MTIFEWPEQLHEIRGKTNSDLNLFDLFQIVVRSAEQFKKQDATLNNHFPPQKTWPRKTSPRNKIIFPKRSFQRRSFQESSSSSPCSSPNASSRPIRPMKTQSENARHDRSKIKFFTAVPLFYSFRWIASPPPNTIRWSDERSIRPCTSVSQPHTHTPEFAFALLQSSRTVDE